MGAGPGDSNGWQWDIAHLRHLVLPAVTLAVIPMGIITRTVRALVADTLNQEFVVSLQARGLGGGRIFRHVAKNAAPTVLAVAGLQVGYLMGGTAIFQRDIPLLQGTILVLCIFFVVLNLLVDLLQPLLDPRIARA
jgi:peptide/nickel transport system permease protein